MLTSRALGSFSHIVLGSICAAALALSACGKGPATVSSGDVRVTVDEDGFHPSAVAFKKGAPGTLVFTRTTDETCATKVVFPDLGIEKDLPRGVPVAIELPTDKARELTFQCGMGMYKSSVVIAE